MMKQKIIDDCRYIHINKCPNPLETTPSFHRIHTTIFFPISFFCQDNFWRGGGVVKGHNVTAAAFPRRLTVVVEPECKQP